MKKLLYLGLIALLLLFLTACGRKADKPDTTLKAGTEESVTPEHEPEPEPEPPIPFTDVPEDASYYDTVVWAYEKGIVSDGSTFEPDSVCTRGQVVMFLWRAMGSPEPQTTENPFSDISSSAWYYKPALWAYENNIITRTTFNPNDSCNNAATLTFLWRAEGEPIASVYNSPIALVASDAYYARPVAWADNNGMFDGMDSAFDPAALCRRVDIVTYLYWAMEQWTFTEEDKTVQAEYEQIVNDAKLYEVHGSGLIHADYVDVDGDGKAELLTFDSGDENYEVVATVYTNINGHAGKACNYTFGPTGSYGYIMYICTYDGHICFRAEGGMRMYGYHDEYYIIEDGEISYNEYVDCINAQPVVEYEGTMGTITEDEYNAIKEKYTNQKELYYKDYSAIATGITIYDRGLLPSAAEYWEANRDKVYAAVLEGDFSYFAGEYEGISYDDNNTSITLDKDGTLTESRGWFNTEKPLSITVTETGSIHCVIEPRWVEYYYDGEIEWAEFFDICPVGAKYSPDPELFYDVFEVQKYSVDEVRIMYADIGGSAGGDSYQYHKVQ